MIHGAPALVLAQHLGRNLRFKGSPVCDRPHSASADTNAFLDRLLRDMRVRFSDSEQWCSPVKASALAKLCKTPNDARTRAYMSQKSAYESSPRTVSLSRLRSSAVAAWLVMTVRS